MKKYYSKNLEDTQSFAQRTVTWIENQNLQKALVIALTGELGAGKTTFVQDLAQSLGIEEKVLSPTFLILKKFEVSFSDYETLYHLDCYRIEEPKELLDLGFEGIIQNPQNIVVIEWADRIEEILPEHYLKLNFKVKGETEREVEIKPIK